VSIRAQVPPPADSGRLAPSEQKPPYHTEWIENRSSRGWLPRFSLRELIAARELALVLAIRDLKLRYKQTFFGVAWALIQPLAGAILFSLTIGQLTHLPHDKIRYTIFVYAGLVVWTYVSTSVTSAAESLVEYRLLVTRIYFPRLLAPLAAVLPGLIDLGVSLPLLGIFIVLYGVHLTVALVLVPLWIAAAALVALSIGILLAALNVQYRDVRYALTFLLQLWFFASPIVYASSLVHGIGRYAYSLNPVVAVIDGFRWSVIGAPVPPTADFVSLATFLVLLMLGLMYFGRVERRFADQL
jgi:lipopolysaccharide transport system permease protein